MFETSNSHKICRVGNVNLNLRRAGQGTPILFLHGAGGISEWTPFFKDLSQNYDVWAPDHPGFGLSEDPSFIKNMSDLTVFYLDFLNTYAPEGGFHVVGHSMGGWLAAEIATRNAQHIKSLTLISSAGLQLEGVPMGDVFTWSAEEAVKKLIFDPIFQEKRLLYQPTPEEAEIIAKNKFTFAKLAQQPRLFNPELKKLLHLIKVPAQIIWGEHDGLIPKEYARLWSDALNTNTCTILSQCSHSPANEKPLETAQLVKVFIEKLKK
jgi:pimeloyl-ACP methyl ester carboxylesterase